MTAISEQTGSGTAKTCANNGADEKDDLLAKENPDLCRAERLRNATLVICIISVISTLIQGCATLAIAFIENSAASFAFSLTAIMDALTSIVVIWRYCGKHSDIFAVEKERRALFFLGILFVISFCTTFGKSLFALIHTVHPAREALIWYVAICNTVMSCALACGKFYLSAQLKSKSIFTDGINSSISTILAAAIIASSIVYDYHKSVWFLDAIVGIICAGFLLVYGVILLHSGHSSICRLIRGKSKDKFDYVTLQETKK